MIRLLRETIDVIHENKKKLEDVLWVGSEDYGYITWVEFAKIADTTEYNNGYGGAEIATDLVVVGKDWWLERHEYDGSEWWEYKSLPVKPELHQRINIKVIGNNSWSTLKEKNEEEDL